MYVQYVYITHMKTILHMYLKISYEFLLMLAIQEHRFSFNLIGNLTSVFPFNHVKKYLVSISST